MTVIWSGVTSEGAVVPVQVDGAGRVVATTGEPPGPPVIEYSGASSWGDVAADGTIVGALNVSSVTKTGTGEYQVLFTAPMPNAEYAVTATQQEFSGTFISVTDKTPTGFNYVSSDGTGAKYDTFVAFAVYSSNALPPMGGTGTDSWGSVDAAGSLLASFNVASVTRTSFGLYDVVFTTPMPTADYAVNTTLDAINTSYVSSSSHTTSGFTVAVYYGTGGVINYGDAAFSFSVNGTNAVLPVTVTAEQLLAVTNNWYLEKESILTTRYKVEMQEGIVFAGGKAGITRDGELYFTSNGGKYVIAVNDEQIGLTRIDSAY